jgi:hypothetical protein
VIVSSPLPHWNLSAPCPGVYWSSSCSAFILSFPVHVLKNSTTNIVIIAPLLSIL